MSYPNRIGQVENGMIESPSIQERRERNTDETYNLFADPDFLFELAADLAKVRANYNEDDYRKIR